MYDFRIILLFIYEVCTTKNTGDEVVVEDELARALSEDGSAASTFITPKTFYSNI